MLWCPFGLKAYCCRPGLDAESLGLVWHGYHWHLCVPLLGGLIFPPSTLNPIFAPALVLPCVPKQRFGLPCALLAKAWSGALTHRWVAEPLMDTADYERDIIRVPNISMFLIQKMCT